MTSSSNLRIEYGFFSADGKKVFGTPGWKAVPPGFSGNANVEFTPPFDSVPVIVATCYVYENGQYITSFTQSAKSVSFTTMNARSEDPFKPEPCPFNFIAIGSEGGDVDVKSVEEALQKMKQS